MPPSHLVEKLRCRNFIEKKKAQRLGLVLKGMLDDVATGRDKLSPEEYDPVNYEKQNGKKQADSIFRSPAGEILAVVYKDGRFTRKARGSALILMQWSMPKGLSEHESVPLCVMALLLPLGSRAVASYYDYNKPAPTMREIHEEERIL